MHFGVGIEQFCRQFMSLVFHPNDGVFLDVDFDLQGSDFHPQCGALLLQGDTLNLVLSLVFERGKTWICRVEVWMRIGECLCGPVCGGWCMLCVSVLGCVVSVFSRVFKCGHNKIHLILIKFMPTDTHSIFITTVIYCTTSQLSPCHLNLTHEGCQELSEGMFYWKYPQITFLHTAITLQISIKLMKIFILLVLALAVWTAPPAPVWPDAFEQSFDEIFVDGNKTEIVNGILYYDEANNRSRLDRADGRFDMFCSSLLPNVTTACVNLVRDSNRYIYFPAKKKCCMCCTADKGCGILKRDWLSDAEYLGPDDINGRQYFKWNKDGTFGYNWYWETTDDNRIPRRINENGTHIFDFTLYSYKKRPQNAALFDLPDYCNSTCDVSTICNKFQSGQVRERALMI